MRRYVVLVGCLAALLAIGLAYALMDRQIGSADDPQVPRTTLPIEAVSASTPDIGPRLEAITKRLDTLTEEVAALKQSATRTSASAAQRTPAPGEFLREHREDVLRIVAEDQDRRALEAKTPALREAVTECAIHDDLPAERIPDCLAVLLDAQKRYDELCRRLVPAGEDPHADGPWRLALDGEVEKLFEWRHKELIRLVGVRLADMVAGQAQQAQGF